jgi:hypothetical protein
VEGGGVNASKPETRTGTPNKWLVFTPRQSSTFLVDAETIVRVTKNVGTRRCNEDKGTLSQWQLMAVSEKSTYQTIANAICQYNHLPVQPSASSPLLQGLDEEPWHRLLHRTAGILLAPDETASAAGAARP